MPSETIEDLVDPGGFDALADEAATAPLVPCCKGGVKRRFRRVSHVARYYVPLCAVMVEGAEHRRTVRPAQV